MAESPRSGSRLSRRGFLRTGLGIGTALLLPDLPGSISVAGVASAHDHESVGRDEEWKDFKPGAPFVEPEIRRSANGELNTTLRMQYAYKNIGGSRLCVRTYEGAVPGPTLRLKPGDVLRIKLINDRPPNRDPKPIDHSLPHQVDDRQRPAERSGRSRLPHPRQRYVADQDQRRGAGGAHLAGHGDRPAQWQHHLPVALHSASTCFTVT